MLIWSDHEVATCRPGFGGRPMLGDRLRLWRRKNLLVVGGVIQRRAKPAVPPARSYIIPAVCTQYYRRHAWYVCGTVEQIIEHLWLKREPVHNNTEEDDGA